MTEFVQSCGSSSGRIIYIRTHERNKIVKYMELLCTKCNLSTEN